MKTTLSQIYKYFIWLGLTGLFLVFVLNYLWLIYYGFDRTPVLAVDALFIFNLVLIFSLARQNTIAKIILYGLNILICLLGLILIRGLIFNI